MIVTRMTAKVFLGYSVCRNLKWLKFAIKFPHDVFTTAFILRMAPPWTLYIIAHILPSCYRVDRHYAIVNGILRPVIVSHNEAKEKRSHGMRVQEQNKGFSWMLDMEPTMKPSLTR